MYEVFFTDHFTKKLKKIVKNDSKLTSRIELKIKKLAENPKHPSLRLHKLSGQGNWSMSVNMSIRILINIEGKYIYCTDIGTHDEVY
jgi:mRNA-degrading endonuclease YafQ of YafQ-DinJ toxin-antitoxin module